MTSVTTLNWLEMRRLISSRVRLDKDEDEETRSLRLARENACLTQDNTRLRSEYEDLAASTQTWIRLYEAALERANTAAAECSRAATGGTVTMAHLWPAMSITRLPPVNVRPARAVRLIEQNGLVVAYPEPHLTPVLPGAWIPLTREEQDAVLKACDTAPEALVLRLGSLWEPGAEYRVYQLSGEWSGLFVASNFGQPEDPADPRPSTPRNRQLLALGRDALHAVSIALNFFNWDLETNGHPWRLNAAKDGSVQL